MARTEVFQDANLAFKLLDLAPDAGKLGLDLEHVLELACSLVEDLHQRLFLGLLVLDPRFDVVELLGHVLRRPRVLHQFPQADDFLHQRLELIDGHAELPLHRPLCARAARHTLLGDIPSRTLDKLHHLLGGRIDVLDDQVDLGVVNDLPRKGQLVRGLLGRFAGHAPEHAGRTMVLGAASEASTYRPAQA